MKQKTAMMELIEKLQEIKDLDSDVQILIISGMQQMLLEKEKEGYYIRNVYDNEIEANFEAAGVNSFIKTITIAI